MNISVAHDDEMCQDTATTTSIHLTVYVGTKNTCSSRLCRTRVRSEDMAENVMRTVGL